MPTPDEFEAAGLLDPTDASVVGRLDLLNWLADLGFTIAQMRDALLAGGLGGMAGDNVLVPGTRHTRAEAIERAGLAPDVFDAYSRAFGFEPIGGSPPGEVGYTDAEIGLFATIESLSDIFTRDEALALVRVIGSAIARVGEAAVSLFLVDIESPQLLAGLGELEIGRAGYEAAQRVDGLAAQLDPLLRRHVLQASERTRAATIDDPERFQYRYAIGFVDLVGYTSLSGNLTARELARFIGRFESRAHDVVSRAGARVVKLIGDEIMFAAIDPSAACRAGGDLIDAFVADADVVRPRGGMAYGTVVLRGGDYYGSVANLASRLADQAAPGELLATAALAEAAVGCTFEPAGRRIVKGFDEAVTVFSVVSPG